MTLRFISATRLSQAEFEANSPLCRSLRRASGWDSIELTVSADNKAGLPHVYNRSIEAADGADTLVFVHDDVWVDDWFISHRLNEALAVYDVVGVAGNTRWMPMQQNWFLAGDTHEVDSEHLSGGVAHGHLDQSMVFRYGTAPAAAQLLDGVMIAVRAESLKSTGVRFDTAFDFHFYDTDFCRSCSAAGLCLGTWPIALTHASPGQYKSREWNLAYERYLKKWGE